MIREPGIIAMEPCVSAHYWARELRKLGSEAQLIAPRFVRPFVKTNKNDAADATANWDAVRRPDMREAARLIAIAGVEILTAPAILATVGDMKSFRSGREFASFLRLVPRQSDTGGKVRSLGISKRDDTYLRSLPSHGARTAVNLQTNNRNPWIDKLHSQQPHNVVVIALANKMARTIWALLAKDRQYYANYVPKVVTAA